MHRGETRGRSTVTRAADPPITPDIAKSVLAIRQDPRSRSQPASGGPRALALGRSTPRGVASTTTTRPIRRHSGGAGATTALAANPGEAQTTQASQSAAWSEACDASDPAEASAGATPHTVARAIPAAATISIAVGKPASGRWAKPTTIVASARSTAAPPRVARRRIVSNIAEPFVDRRRLSTIAARRRRFPALFHSCARRRDVVTVELDGSSRRFGAVR